MTMKNFYFNVAMSIRTYGGVDVEAETIEEAKAKLTADYVAKNFEPAGSGNDDFDWDHPTEIYCDGYVSVTDYDAGPNQPMDWDMDIDDFELPEGEWMNNPKYAIAAVLDGELLWWTNEDGWGDRETRTIFSEAETRYLRMPLLDDGKAFYVLEDK